MQATSDFPDIAPDERQDLAIDFSSYLQAGDTITSITSWTASVAEQSLVVDPTPAARLVGAPEMANPTTVAQTVAGCLANVTYIMEALVQTGLGENLSIWSVLRCVPVGQS